MTRDMVCKIHGRCGWSGEVLCTRCLGGCGRVWQMFDMMKPLFKSYGSKCDCGEQLSSDNESPSIPICPICFITLKPCMEMN